jgi:hypothetical protein
MKNDHQTIGHRVQKSQDSKLRNQSQEIPITPVSMSVFCASISAAC